MKTRSPRLLVFAALPLICLGASQAFAAITASPSLRAIVRTPNDDTRELAGLAEEQALLTRQIQRLRQTMEVLTGRLEAEGRTHAVGLLRDGLAIIDRRAETTEGLTLDERMGEAGDELTGGQWMQSLERQQTVVADLESLLEVLLDRQDLDKLEEKLEEIAATREALTNLSREQSDLQRKSEDFEASLQEGSIQEFTEGLNELQQAERDLLQRTEASGRSSTTLERERIERELLELKDAEDRVAELLVGWKPGDQDELADARSELELAQDRERAAQVLEETAERLERTAEDLAADAPLESGLDQMKDAQEALKRAARNLTQGSAEEETTEAIAGATETVAQSQAELRAERQQATAEGRSELEQALAERAQELRDQAEALKQDAQIAKEAAAQKLGQGGEPSPRAESVLSKLAEGAEAALGELRTQEEVQEFLPEAIAGAQDELAKLTADLMEALERLAEASVKEAEASAESAGQAQQQAQQQAQ